VEGPESARELTRNFEVEVDITRIVLVQVVQRRKKSGGVEFVDYFFKSGLTSKEGKSRLWSGWEAKRKWDSLTAGVCDRRSSRHRMRGRAGKKIVSVAWS
jgi:hypothetical protein